MCSSDLGVIILCDVVYCLERQQAREVEAAAALREVCDGRGSRLDVLLGVQLAVEDHHHRAVLVDDVRLAAAQHEEVFRDTDLVPDLVILRA